MISFNVISSVKTLIQSHSLLRVLTYLIFFFKRGHNSIYDTWDGFRVRVTKIMNAPKHQAMPCDAKVKSNSTT